MNDFMGSADEFYEFLKVEATRLRREITAGQRVAEANPERRDYHDHVLTLVQQRHDIQLFIGQRQRDIEPYKLKDPDYILKREYLYSIMTGEAEPFFEHMRQELIAFHGGIMDLRNDIHTCRSTRKLYTLEKIMAAQKPRYDDLFKWMLANDPQA